MLMSDLSPLRHLEAPVKAIVFGNDALAVVGLEMKAAGTLEFATGLYNRDFVKAAEDTGLLELLSIRRSRSAR